MVTFSMAHWEVATLTPKTKQQQRERISLKVDKSHMYVHTTFMQSALSFLYSGPDQLEPHIYNTCSACTPVHVHAISVVLIGLHVPQGSWEH